jgi:glucose-6-phosphate isomerase
MSLILPFQTMLNLNNGALEPRGYTTKRYLQDMLTAYADSEAIAQILQQEGNRLIYEVQGVNLPEETGQVLYGTTTIYPGQIGEEFHMTKGHFHRLRDRAEFYMGLAGEGYVLLETEEGEVQAVPMQPGAIVYVPPFWAHRTINSGEEPLIFLSVWPGDAGHDYGTIEESGFARRLVKRNGQAIFIENERKK